MTWLHPLRRPHARRSLWPWLRLPASLTAALRRAYGGQQALPQAEVLAIGRQRARRDERTALKLSRGEWVFWREVQLHGPDPKHPAIWARTAFPLRAIRRGLRPLTRHGSRPIGNTLFRHGRLQRSPILMQRQPTWHGQGRWRRASVLFRGRLRLRVEEHFLEGMPRWRGRGRP